MPLSSDFDLDSYCFDLEPELIAQHPAQKRSCSRMLVLDKKSGSTRIAGFQDLCTYLSPGSLLVANNTRVLPARLEGSKKTGGRVEFLLLTPLPLIKPEFTGPEKSAPVECLLKASRHPKPGEWIYFRSGVRLKVLENASMGRTRGQLFWMGDLAQFFIKNGRMPLPPYIQRPENEDDHERYQTVYSSTEKLGSVAAPTAGFHFSPELRERLELEGFG